MRLHRIATPAPDPHAPPAGQARREHHARRGHHEPDAPAEAPVEELARRPVSSFPPAASGELTDLAKAVVAHDARGDRVASAVARLELGMALMGAFDVAAREVLEDAGTRFEELGDDDGMLAVDAALREAAEWIEESPRSFHRRSVAMHLAEDER